MSRPYEFVDRGVLEQRVSELTAIIHTAVMHDWLPSRQRRRELRKINKELRFRDQWEVSPEWRDAHDYNTR